MTKIDKYKIAARYAGETAARYGHKQHNIKVAEGAEEPDSEWDKAPAPDASRGHGDNLELARAAKWPTFRVIDKPKRKREKQGGGDIDQDFTTVDTYNLRPVSAAGNTKLSPLAKMLNEILNVLMPELSALHLELFTACIDLEATNARDSGLQLW